MTETYPGVDGKAITQIWMLNIISQEVRKYGSIRSAAKAWGCSPSYLSEVLNGKAPPGDAVLGPLGYERFVTVNYRRKAKV